MKKKRGDIQQKSRSGLFLFLMMLLIAFTGITVTAPTPVSAVDAESTPKAHYDKYGSKIGYFDNGYLYWADRYSPSSNTIRWQTMGFRVFVTANGRTTYVDYSTGGGMESQFITKDAGISNIAQNTGGYRYTRDGINYNTLIEDITAKNSTLGRDMSSGDYDVRVEFDSITETFNDSTNKQIGGPYYTAAQTKAGLSALGMGTSTVDNYYGLTINIDNLSLPIVKYVTKGVSYPNGGGDLKSGSTYLY